ncbi:MAG: SIMPL domain-containing protein [Alphaproteobacteria bacterium]|nr:SIMPL domain-containing protein [Alphaproteobacteria bacterium]
MKAFIYSGIIAIGLSFGGYFSAKQISSAKQLIEVKGLSEKIVKSDLCTITIDVENTGETIEDTQKQLQKSIDIILDDLKKINLNRKDVLITSRTYDRNTEEYNDGKKVNVKKFEMTKSLKISTNNIDAPKAVEEMLSGWLSKNILVRCDYEYKLSDFNKLKKEMMKEAAQNARDCAQSFVGALGEELGELVYLNQGVISMSASDESEASNSWYGQTRSAEKKLRLVVRAGFKKKDIVGK